MLIRLTPSERDALMKIIGQKDQSISDYFREKLINDMKEGGK